MNQKMVDITEMICRVFRLAETTWQKTPEETAAIFKKYNILEFIMECYDGLHLAGDCCVLDDIEMILRNNGVFV